MMLSEAALKLGDADASVRDAAQREILAAKRAAVPHLVDALKRPGAPVAKIALFLAALEGTEGVMPLVELVERGVLDMDTRIVVARALAELVTGQHAGDARVRHALKKLARDGTPATRTSAVKALGALGDVDSVATLKSMAFSEPHPDVKAALVVELKQIMEREQALKALGQSAPPQAEGGLHLDLEAAVRAQQQRASLVVAEELQGPFSAIIKRMRDPRWAVRNQAVEEAVSAGKAIVPLLIDVLDAGPASARIGAAQALARLQAPDAVGALLAAVLRPPVDDDDRVFIPIGLKALANSMTGSEEGIAQPLLPLTRDPDPFVRAGALLCLGRTPDRIAARVATTALTDPHDHVREAAAVALSEGIREEDRDLVLPLLAILGGIPAPPIAVREAILLALSRIDVDDAPTVIRLRHRVRVHVLGLTSSLRRTAIAILERSYHSDDPPPLGVIDDVMTRLGDDHPEVRLLAASFLAHHIEPGMTGAVEKLEDALDREERSVSLLCLDALRRHDTPKAKLALQAVAEDTDEVLAARAKELLEGFEPKTEEWVAPAASVAPAAVERASVEKPATETPARKQKPARVRPASSDNTAVVEAKVPPASRLKDQLAAARPEERERVLAAFESSIPQPRKRLCEALRDVDNLIGEERERARKKIIDGFA